jgi:two-component system nitrogen regulation sensor histidine kinase NtrY
MKEQRRTLFLVISVIIVFIMAIVAESIYFSNFEYHFRTGRFNRVLWEKEKIADECLNGMRPFLASGEPHGSVIEKNIFLLAEENKITILEYIDNKLIHWSDNDFDVPLQLQDDSLFAKPIVFLQNGWFLPKTLHERNETIVGLVRVRTDYGFENDIIKSGFEKNFRIPADVGFSTASDSSEYKIYNDKGTFLFSLLYPENKSHSLLMLVPLVLWILLLFLILRLTLELVKIFVRKGNNISGIIACLLIFASLYFLVLIIKRPSVIFNTGLFSPFIFSLNGIIPSLGHLLLLSILTAVFSWVIYRNLPMALLRKGENLHNYLVMTALIGAGAISIGVYHILFSQLITDSNISFETYKVLKLNFYSFAGFLCIILLSLVPLFLVLKAFQTGNQSGNKSLILSYLTSLLIIVLFFYNDKWSLLPVTLFYTALILFVWITGSRRTGIFNMSVIFSLLLGLYSLFVITVYSERKTTENLKILALSFSTENDPEAENLLLDLWPVIKSDTILVEMMETDIFGQNDFNLRQNLNLRISNYLDDNYFNGYWGNFTVSKVLCRSNESMLVGDNENSQENCFGFFDERIRKYGHQLTGTGFYFIDNQGGRSYYLGRLFFEKEPGVINGLFIELYSNINVFQQGYSELLLDKKFRGLYGLREYSFAKYINGRIVLKSGDFAYNKEDEEYVDKNSDYRVFSLSGFRHVLYRNGNATVLISRPELNAGNIIISFAYLFAFILLFSNLLIVLITHSGFRNTKSFNFREKLQASFIGILLFSFILIGIVVAYLTVNEYQSRHYDNIKEKLNSIYIELDNKLSTEKQLSPDWRNSSNSSLNDLLIKLSNIFNTDINLYNLTGHLIATSRPEIFYRDLTSHRMNIMALINVADLTKSEYFQKEKIGEMEYISVYVPFYNAENNLLGYLNLPYFRMQSLLAREISNLIVVVINFTLLLVLITMAFAVFISGRLTTPLSMLGDGLASVELGKKSEHLSYRGSDEIGELVKQYNRMVDELEESTHKLTNSEREYAWREMAKQIAHEIKNPLTPMKLNVQQLLKSYRDGAPGFGEKIEGFTRNQIEYIDNLSSIASAFSSFAKMPGTSPVEVNLVEQINTTLELFKNTDNVTFQVHWPYETKVFIYADREHLNGIFSNIFKNSIQSIPAGRKGLIKVMLEVVASKVIISVSDNGSGIPEELQKKLFTPNFTTKSSGMGLGLSIVKKYIEGANGRIWFESEADKGTTFHIEFPLKYTVEKPGAHGAD